MTDFTMNFMQEVTTQALFIAIVLDILTGVARAWEEKKINSTVGLNGLIRHTIIVIAVFLLGYLTTASGTPWFGHTITIAFALQNVASIFENWRLAGHEIPEAIEDILDKVKTQQGVTERHDKNDEEKIMQLKERFTKEEIK